MNVDVVSNGEDTNEKYQQNQFSFKMTKEEPTVISREEIDENTPKN